jgi:hypothetical protein
VVSSKSRLAGQLDRLSREVFLDVHNAVFRYAFSSSGRCFPC